MGIIIKQSIKSTTYSYLGVFVGIFNVFYLCSKFLSIEQLGLYISLTTIPIFLSGIAQLGISNTMARFYHKFDSYKHNAGILSICLVICTIGLAFLIGIFYVFSDFLLNIYKKNSSLINENIYSIFLITIIITYGYVLEAYCRANLKTVFPAFVRELFSKICNTFSILAFGLGYIQFDLFIKTLVFSNLISLALLFIYIGFIRKLNFKINIKAYNKTLIKDLLLYNMGTFLSGFSGMLVVNIEKMFLPAYKNGLLSTALFDIGSKFGLIISIPKNGIAMISNPIIAKAWTTNNVEEINTIYKKSASNLLLVGIFIYVCLLLNIDDIFNIMPNSELYRKAKFVFIIVGLSRLIDMATGLNTEILQNSKYYYYDFFFTIILAVSLVSLNLFLIPLYSFNGAAIASFFSILILNSIKSIFIYYKFKLHFFSLEMIKVVSLGILCFVSTKLISVYVIHFHPLINITIIGFLFSIQYWIGIFHFNLSPDINKILLNLINRKIKS